MPIKKSFLEAHGLERPTAEDKATRVKSREYKVIRSEVLSEVAQALNEELNYINKRLEWTAKINDSHYRRGLKNMFELEQMTICALNATLNKKLGMPLVDLIKNWRMK